MIWRRWSVLLVSVVVVGASAFAAVAVVGTDGAADAAADGARTVTSGDFYNKARVKDCPGPDGCDFGLLTVQCNSGDTFTGGLAWRQDRTSGEPKTVLSHRLVGSPARGIKADASFVPAGQKAMVRIICADTG